MRPLLPLALAALVLAPAVAAQGAFMPFIGYNTDTENPLVGVGTRFSLPIPAPVAVSLQPTVEFEFTDIDGTTLLQADINAVVGLPGSTIQPYLGAGAGIRYIDIDGLGSDSNTGLNLLGGVTLNPIGFVQPFVQARYSIFDGGEQLSVQGGVALGL